MKTQNSLPQTHMCMYLKSVGYYRVNVVKLIFGHFSAFTALVADRISVVHITDDGMAVIKLREITDTHVVVDTPHLSAYGIVWDLIKRFKDFITPKSCCSCDCYTDMGSSSSV